jgi:hypothetical protein
MLVKCCNFNAYNQKESKNLIINNIYTTKKIIVKFIKSL